METIAVARPPTPPAADAPPQREDKDTEDTKTASFDKALTQELALRAHDGKPAPEEAGAKDPAAADKADDKKEADSAAVVDPALAALLADPARQPQLAALQAAAAGTGPHAGRTDAMLDAAAKSRDPTERRPIELNASEAGTTERSAVDRVVSARDAKARALELAERRGAPKSDESPLHDRAHGAEDGAAQSAFSASSSGPAGAQAFTPAASVPNAPLDSFAAASMVTKWSGSSQALLDAAPAPATARIDTALGDPGWSDAFQQKIVWLVDRQQQSAELHINPPHLGPVDVMLNFSDDGARVAFCSPHAAVREAIQASLPDLQTALGDRGVALSQTMVSADPGAAREQFSQAANQDAQGGGGARHARGPSGSSPLAVDVPRTMIVARGLVDTFA